MEGVGIAVDAEMLHGLEAHFAGAVAQAQQDAFDALPQPEDGSARTLNLGSPKQLQVVLFDELKMPKTKRTKTGYTTDAEALADLFAATEHPFLGALLRHRDASRLRQTVEGLIKSVSAGRPDPHDVQPDHRGDRPDQLDRPQPAEHPDPHRRGPPDPRGVRRRRRASAS